MHKLVALNVAFVTVLQKDRTAADLLDKLGIVSTSKRG